METDDYWQKVALLMPIITATLVAIFGLIVFLSQKSIERRIAYRADVQKRYESYLHSIFEFLADPESTDKDAKFQQSRVSLRLYASKRVLAEAKQFEDHITGVKKSKFPNRVSARLVGAMRQHVVPRSILMGSKLSEEELEELRSFNVNS